MRISVLMKAGLIRRSNGIYSLTSLGKVVHTAQSLVGEAVDNYWKLKAIDSIESSENNNAFSTEERKKLMDSLIDEESEIKDILLKS